MKVIVITGSTKGIGLGLAEEFLKRDCCVIISSRRQDAVDEAVKNLGQKYGVNYVFGTSCDVTNYNDVKRLWDFSISKFKKIDIWINNAGASNCPRPIWRLDEKDIELVVKTNLHGTVYGTMVAIEGMRLSSGGHIYNFEGFGSKNEMQPGLAVYGATKRAVAYLSKALNKELLESAPNVKLSVISPGIVITDLLVKDIDGSYTEQKWNTTKTIFNILGDRVEVVCPYLAEKVLENDETGASVAWLNGFKVLGKFLGAFNRPDYFEGMNIKNSDVDYFKPPPENYNRDKKQTVIVTGGSRGIGFGLLREFLKLGCNVAFCSRSEKDVNSTIQELKNFADGSKIYGRPCDVNNPHDLNALYIEAKEKFGCVDVWINNAGTTTTPLPLWQLPHEQIDAVLNTNVLGTIYGTVIPLKYMIEQGFGQVYNMEGLGSKDEIQVGLTTYGLSKSAVGYLNKAVITEIGKNCCVQMCSIRPGINVTSHLIHDAHVLGKKKWENTKKIFNILGDKPETTTPYLAKEVLENRVNGKQIAWLDTMTITWRFMTAGFQDRDLFEGMDVQFPDEFEGVNKSQKQQVK